MNRTIVSLAVAAVTAGSVTFVALDGSAAATATRTDTQTHTLRIRITGLDGGGQQTRSGFVAASTVTTLQNALLGYLVDSAAIGAGGITDR